MAAQAPDTIYAALEGDGLWRSEDGGETWAFVMDRPYLDGEEHDVLSLVSVAHETGMGGIWLYAGTRAGLTRVPDCFCRWQDVVAGDALDALVAGDTPVTAASLPEGEPIEILALAPDAPQRLLAALPSGLWLSTDAGVNWEQTASDPVTALTTDPADPLHVIAADAAGLRVGQSVGNKPVGLGWLQRRHASGNDRVRDVEPTHQGLVVRSASHTVRPRMLDSVAVGVFDRKQIDRRSEPDPRREMAPQAHRSHKPGSATSRSTGRRQ